MSAALAIVLAVALQRLWELWRSARNTRWLRAQGAVEAGRAHYLLIVALHGAWLATLLVVAVGAPPIRWGWLLGFLALQPLRLWVLGTLGRRWTTRILVLPAERRIARGPYRWLRHPNYLVVALEIPLLALALEAPLAAFVLGVLNLAVLGLRIRAEEAAWAGLQTPPARPPAARSPSGSR